MVGQGKYIVYTKRVVERNDYAQSTDLGEDNNCESIGEATKKISIRGTSYNYDAQITEFNFSSSIQ